MTTCLVTGAAGFLGHHLVEHLLKNTNWNVIGLDKFNYASLDGARLHHNGVLENPRFRIIKHDLAKPLDTDLRQLLGNVNYIVHMAAETHVERSITDPQPFIDANVQGTMNLLQYARTLPALIRMLYFSTDEVYGPAMSDGRRYQEWDRYNSSNPYAATKAAGEEMCLAFHNTFHVPVVISHCMNAFGERQYPEKLIPVTMQKVWSGEVMPIYAYPGKQKAGERGWIHARTIADAVVFILQHEEMWLKINIPPQIETDNLTIAQMIAEIMGKELNYELVDFHSERPGHDLKYTLDGTTLLDLGWKLPMTFEESFRKTIQWEVKNRNWLAGVQKRLGRLRATMEDLERRMR
jgi:dTDP-glucose 4,6-dehydratase